MDFGALDYRLVPALWATFFPALAAWPVMFPEAPSKPAEMPPAEP